MAAHATGPVACCTRGGASRRPEAVHPRAALQSCSDFLSFCVVWWGWALLALFIFWLFYTLFTCCCFYLLQYLCSAQLLLYWVEEFGSLFFVLEFLDSLLEVVLFFQEIYPFLFNWLTYSIGTLPRRLTEWSVGISSVLVGLSNLTVVKSFK